jgi:multimeric flavodoxin WrbA
MADRKVIVLDGSQPGDEDLAPLLAILIDELRHNGTEVQTYTLREVKLGHCIGCFGCWIETPGICVEADAGREIVQAIVRSEMTVLFTPVNFGGYSSVLKKIVDRWIPLMLPYFGNYHREIHHKPRYSRFPRLVAIGVQRDLNSEEARIFKAVVGRNAINFHAPSYAAEVIMSTDDSDSFRGRLKTLLSRIDPLPLGEALTSLMPVPDTSIASAKLGRPDRALLIVGSPKTKSPSTSGVLGGYLLERLRERGWETELLTLQAGLQQEKRKQDLVSSVDRADLLLLAFPLYIDALPFLVTKALEVIAVHGRVRHEGLPQRLIVLSNNGFPEAHQNTLSLAICHRFALQNGMRWAGGLAMGAGEALSGGQSLTSKNRSGPPVKHVIQALDLTAAALAEGKPLPSEVVPMIARNPIPLLPFAAWRWIFVKAGARHWQRQAAANGISKGNMLAQPFAEYEVPKNRGD